MKKRYYIAYGSNLSVEQMAQRCPDAKVVGLAALGFLAGFVLGEYPLRKLMRGFHPYKIATIRLLGIPALYCGLLLLVGIRGAYLLLPLLIFTMPLGLNLVVFPESLGEDASENAKLCFVSYIMAAFILPVTFAALTWLGGIA